MEILLHQRWEKPENIPGGENRVGQDMEIRNRVDSRVKMTHNAKIWGGDKEKVLVLFYPFPCHPVLL